jgi:hypothetical protein
MIVYAIFLTMMMETSLLSFLPSTHTRVVLMK